MKKWLIYKSRIAPIEIYQNEHEQYFLYYNNKMKIMTKDKNYAFLRLKEYEKDWVKKD